MLNRVTALIGPARSGKTEWLLARYRAFLTAQPLGNVLWLAPTWRAATEVRERLLDGGLPGCFRPGITTFKKYAESVLQAAGLPIRPLTRLMKRELVRQQIEEQSRHGRLRHFGPIANTSGLVDLVCEFISELKRLEIWPEELQRACADGGITAKDSELLEIYDAYQQALREHDLYDAEGSFWSARDVLRRAEAGRWKMNLLVVDGFTDFTRTQHEMLQILARDAEQFFVSLPLEPEPCRADLFAKPLVTLEKLKKGMPGLVVERLPRPSDAVWPAMAHLEQTLLVNPRLRADSSVAVTAPEARGIEILAAARPEGEARLIGAKIKRLLVDATAKPSEIAVVLRSLSDAGSLFGEVFGRLGIPVFLEQGQTLDRSPALRALVRLLQLDLNDWPLGELLSLVGSNYFRPEWSAWQGGKAAAEVDQTIRRLQIPRGRDRLLAALRQPTGDSTIAEGVQDSGPQRPNDEKITAKTMGSLLERLALVFDKLPQKAILADWAKAWQQLASQTGLHRALRESVADVEASAGMIADLAAWDRLMEVLAADQRLAQWLQRRPPELDRPQAFEMLLDILRSERIGPPGDEAGCVRVLSAASVRSLRIPYLFLAGLSEKAFPPPDREDRLYGEADYLRLISAGLPLVARSERNREEMLLFYEAVTRATKRLYLSFPAVDESAQPLAPSPYLEEVDEAFGGQIPRTQWADLSPVPRGDEPLCEEDFRVMAVAAALGGNAAPMSGAGGQGSEVRDVALGESVALMAGLMGAAPFSAGKRRAAMVENLAAGLELNYLRQDRGQFGPAEGMLSGRAAHEYLLALFSPQHVFSATHLEQYASCPFRFFLENVLGIKPLVDLTLEFDVLERGRLGHAVLADFHRRINERFGRPASPLELDPEQYDCLLGAALNEATPPPPENPVELALAEVSRRQLAEWLAKYRSQCEKYDRQWQECEVPLRPALFEVSFGRIGSEPPSTESPMRLEAGKDTIRMSGRIDRIDTGMVAGHAVFNVIDYKTGSPLKFTPDTVTRGTTLQLPLYALAVLDLLLADRDAVPWAAAYWYLRDEGIKPRQALRMYRKVDGRFELDSKWEEMRAGLAGTVSALVGGIRQGSFAVCSADDRCTGYCPFSTVCRVNQVRSLEKIWQPHPTPE